MHFRVANCSHNYGMFPSNTMCMNYYLRTVNKFTVCGLSFNYTSLHQNSLNYQFIVVSGSLMKQYGMFPLTVAIYVHEVLSKSSEHDPLNSWYEFPLHISISKFLEL